MRRAGIKARMSRFPRSIFWIVLVILLITAGVNMALVLGMQALGWPPIVMTHIMVFYWIGVTALLTWLIRGRMKVAYETPMQMISEATKEVAQGDFTVRLQPLHEKGKEDYLDIMINDLNDMIGELGSIETLKADFISNVSHEIKTPIAVIRLKISEDTPEHHELSVELSRIERYVDMVLQYIRIGSKSNDLVIREYKLDGMIREALRKQAEQFIEKRLALKYTSTDATVITDQKWLVFILDQLLSNAVKYTSSGTVTVDFCNGLLTVSDTGVGIMPEDLPRIFEKGYTGMNGRIGQKSSGLGLYLAKKAAEMLSIPLSVVSSIGVGSTFILDLRQDRG